MEFKSNQICSVLFFDGDILTLFFLLSRYVAQDSHLDWNQNAVSMRVENCSVQLHGSSYCSLVVSRCLIYDNLMVGNIG